MAENTEPAQQIRHSFLTGALKLYVLNRAAGGTVYGSALARELHQHGYPISPGTLYPLLHSLASEGLLSPFTQVVSGRQRRYYSLTREGQSCLNVARDSLSPFAGEIFAPQA